MFEGLFQPFHLLVILVIALIVFGPGKLSDVGGSLGKAIKGFKKAMNDDDNAGTGPKRIEGEEDDTKPSGH